MAIVPPLFDDEHPSLTIPPPNKATHEHTFPITMNNTTAKQSHCQNPFLVPNNLEPSPLVNLHKGSLPFPPVAHSFFSLIISISIHTG